MIDIATMRHDPALLGRLRGGDSRVPWNAFHKAADGLPMNDEEFGIYQSATGRTDRPTKPFPLLVAMCGRRSGKDSEGITDRVIHRALFVSYDAVRQVGETLCVPIICPDRVQAAATFRYIAEALDHSPMLASEVVARTRESLTLRNHVRIQVRTASWRTIRGQTLPFVALNEAAFFRDEQTSANPAQELLRAVQPATATIPGAQILLASSPYSRSGLLFEMHRKFWGQEQDRCLFWKAASVVMNPTLSQTVIDAAFADDPQAARAEWLAEFRDDVSDFIDRDAVAAVVVPGRTELPPTTDARHFAFVDPSGGSQDSMTLAIAHRGATDGRVVLDLVREVRPPFSPDQVAAEFADLIRRYGLTTVGGDRYGGEWPRERFRNHGVMYTPAGNTKSEIYGSLLPLITAGRVELLDHPRMISQLCSLERRTARSGKDSIDHPPRAHDDLINAAAGALVLAADRRGPVGGYLTVHY